MMTAQEEMCAASQEVFMSHVSAADVKSPALAKPVWTRIMENAGHLFLYRGPAWMTGPLVRAGQRASD